MKTPFTYTLVCITALSSCNVAYRSSVINTPLFSGKKELNLTATGTNVQAAYSFTDHVGVMVNGLYEQRDVPGYRLGYGGNGYMGEVGVGYFRKLFPKPELIAEIYGGAGYGHLNLLDRDQDSLGLQTRTIGADGIRLFIQPALGFKKKNFEISGSIRYSNVNYYHVKTSNWGWPDIEQDKYANLATPVYHFLEPAVTVRLGLRNVKLQLQYLYCIKLNSESIKYNHEVLSVGIFIKLHTGTYYTPLQERRFN